MIKTIRKFFARPDEGLEVPVPPGERTEFGCQLTTLMALSPHTFSFGTDMRAMAHPALGEFVLCYRRGRLQVRHTGKRTGTSYENTTQHVRKLSRADMDAVDVELRRLLTSAVPEPAALSSAPPLMASAPGGMATYATAATHTLVAAVDGRIAGIQAVQNAYNSVAGQQAQINAMAFRPGQPR